MIGIKRCFTGIFLVASVFVHLNVQARGSNSGAPDANIPFSFETVQVLEDRGSPNDRSLNGAASTSAPSRTLRIGYRGLVFDVQLRPNHDLLAGLEPNQKLRLTASASAYRGVVRGMAGSWVRLTQTIDGWSGLIHDGQELMAIEPLQDLVPSSSGARGSYAMYRVADVPAAGTCALDPSATPTLGGLLDELSEMAPTLNAATAQINVAGLLDTQFVGSRNDPGPEAVALFNAVDGIYSDQVGVAVNVSSLVELASNGQLSSSSPQTLLNQLSNLAGTSSLDNPGLVHLLTGRDLNGGVIGIAFLGSLCSESFGVGLSEIRGGSMAAGIVLIAHEIGHNFGAPHDNQGGSACASTPGGFIMNPFLNAAFDRFSQCSLTQIAQEVATASCLVDVPDPNPDPTPTGSCLFSTSFTANDDGFAFVSDVEDGAYTSGARSPGSLDTRVGNVDNADIFGMRGGWVKTCELAEATPVTLTIQARLIQAANYEPDETSAFEVSVNGQTTVLSSLTGDGNGGSDQSTGLQTFMVTADLPAGDSVIAVDCVNSKKTFNDELTTCQLAAMEVAPAADSPDTLLDANFDDGADGFTFTGDPNPANSTYAQGRPGSDGIDGSGTLNVTLGGVDDVDINDMAATWGRTFTASGRASLSVDANLIQASEYEPDEFSSVGIAVDGVFQELARLTGDGNGGGGQETGSQTYRVVLEIAPGEHTLTLDCRNNKKTFSNEITQCVFDNLRIE